MTQLSSGSLLNIAHFLKVDTSDPKLDKPHQSSRSPSTLSCPDSISIP
jgi:hypothetical protein